MKITVFDDHQALSFQVAQMMVAQIKNKPDSVICLASGETPFLAYHLLPTLLLDEGVDHQQFTLIGLDEWVNIPSQNTGSCSYFLHTTLIGPLKLSLSQFKLFDGMAPDLQTECDSMDEFISKRGGIDLMVVGIGMNGHIGFNEPGVSTELYAHVIDLDDTTQTVGQKYFADKTTLGQGITLGLKHLQEANAAILMASGDRKAHIMKATLEGPIDPLIPSTIIRNHPNGLVMLDQKAASLLTPNE
ncbi:6-phosphogluconolactonase [Dyadobacter pollutisoli]|uniref:Glucosamine-6-phosphate deaminase n=1 Tax=Dyadobacter pollutisoli TaxID=2910158 RepID=A0A9E8NE36_9BACT|nr:glucosamine-6-phosphate deaminase [Dyadobacter pollutisoli]WAC15020.1 glucosamine-6-phosphate deaminase [Dyadobacter pollutisoli]